MYWFRDDNLFGLISWLILLVLVWLGGWLLATHLFRLRSRERLLSGLAIGLLLWIVFSNLLANIFGPNIFSPNTFGKIFDHRQANISLAFWGSGVLILGLGIVFARINQNGVRADFVHGRSLSALPRSPFTVDGWLSKEDLNAWLQLLALAGLLIIFSMINRGLAIFDDYHNLPIVSMIAAGDAPPHFYLNPEEWLDYHYGLHLLAASLVGIAGLFPWSAFDLTKALSLSLTVILAWLWFRRTTQKVSKNSIGAATWGSLFVLLGGGARWLLLFLSQGVLLRMGSGLRLLGSAQATGSDLYTLLSSPWKIEGDGPFPFPFAFTNGIFQPLNMAMGGSGAIAQMTIVLLLLLARKRWRPAEGIIFGLLLSSLALTAEHVLLIVLAGMVTCAVWLIASGAYHKQTHTALRQVGDWAWIFIPAALLAVVAGGVITGIFRDAVTQVTETVASASGFKGLTLRWPPSITSSHFGPLALNNPWQILIALVEMGIPILMAPLAMIWTRQRARQGKWTPAWLAIGALLSFVASVFVYYGVERDTSRLIGSALFIWILLGFPLAWSLWEKPPWRRKVLFAGAYSITILGGITLLTIELISIPHPQYTYFIKTPDVQISQKYWDQLEPDAQIFDPLPIRAVTLFGRTVGSTSVDIYTPLPEWLALQQNPTPGSLAQAGYAFVYLDKETWQAWSNSSKQSFQQDCVKEIAEQVTDDKDFRRLLDIRACP